MYIATCLVAGLGHDDTTLVLKVWGAIMHILLGIVLIPLLMILLLVGFVWGGRAALYVFLSILQKLFGRR